MASWSIDIKTSQNVELSFDLASASNRFISNAIDLGIVWIIITISQATGLFSITPATLIMSSAMLAWVYHLFFIVLFRGKTPGMRFIKIEIIKTSGGIVEFQDLILRWIMRPLDITFTLGTLGLFLILGSDKRQRLGDRLADTVVIKRLPDIHFSLEDILRIHENGNASEARFPNVKYFKEKDILMVKNLLHNEPGYDAIVLEQMIAHCANKMSDLLQVKIEETDKAGFLRTIVNDYIVLTR
jgi:uncharacterized RDD family membrane protein YckC